MPDLLPEDHEPETGIGLFEAVCIIALALLVAPGVIWWIVKLIEAGRITWEAFR